MSKGDLTQYDGEVDDGFDGSFSSDRTIKGVQLAWNDSLHWRTRDGMKAPEQLLVIATDAILQRWKEGLPHVIRDKPLPDPDDLNAAIPVSEWETGIDGKPRPPWQDTVVVYFIDPATGGFYTFVSSTTGGRIAVDHLREFDHGHAHATRRARPAGRHVVRAADENEVRCQKPSAFRDCRLEGAARPKARGGADDGFAVRV